MDIGDKYKEAKYQELESALGVNELRQALRRKGDELLQNELELNLDGRPNLFEALLVALKEPAKHNSKERINLSNIESSRTRERLELAIEIFGARRVHEAAQAQYNDMLRRTVRGEIGDVASKIPLRELVNLFAPTPAEGVKFDYKKIKDTDLRRRFRAAVMRCGVDNVFALRSRIINQAISVKMQTAMGIHHSFLEPLKGYAALCADLKTREKGRKHERD